MADQLPDWRPETGWNSSADHWSSSVTSKAALHAAQVSCGSEAHDRRVRVLGKTPSAESHACEQGKMQRKGKDGNSRVADVEDAVADRKILSSISAVGHRFLLNEKVRLALRLH